MSMCKIIAPLMLLGALWVPLGCTSPADQVMFDALGTAWEVVGKEYREYVHEDDSLSAMDKAIRLRSAEIISEALLEVRTK